ncbi:hypothetical protein FB451DRAFT_1398320 [Mycena latifolia]|nr:hypothetical protein FB451DRAFT_1398320 [Mycena latifolia]
MGVDCLTDNFLSGILGLVEIQCETDIYVPLPLFFRRDKFYVSRPLVEDRLPKCWKRVFGEEFLSVFQFAYRPMEVDILVRNPGLCEEQQHDLGHNFMEEIDELAGDGNTVPEVATRGRLSNSVGDDSDDDMDQNPKPELNPQDSAEENVRSATSTYAQVGSSPSVVSVGDPSGAPPLAYSRPDASGSSSSVNSQGRPRTNSNNSLAPGSARSSPSPVPSTKGTGSSAFSPGPAPPGIPDHRNGSSWSIHGIDSGYDRSPSASQSPPSPLSQDTVTAAALPSSRTPAATAYATRSEAVAAASAAPPVKRSGLKGRLRRPLLFKSRAASPFNSRLNGSTDNISVTSTVSSASVMIRKLGGMGRLARRGAFTELTSLIKDKKRRGDEGED